MSKIEIIGAKEHNLKNIDLTIPRNELVVVTGLSGSGKSSLAFDTIYAEGQRRYMETLSAYARQFIGILERPAVESITGLSPIIAIEQKTTGKNPRSTVGTITEIYDFLRLLYARASIAHSPATGEPMVKYSNEQIVQLILNEYAGKKCIVLSPLVQGRKGHYKELIESLIKKGYQQVRIDGKLCDLVEVEPLDRYKNHFIELVVDKLVPNADDYKRIYESVDKAVEVGKGLLAIMEYGAAEEADLRYFSKHLMCPVSGISFPEPAPHTFSFNSPVGACPKCKGLGYISKIDFTKIIPDAKKSILQGAIEPLGSYKDNKWFRILESMARAHEFSLNEPVCNLPDDILNSIIYGSDEMYRVNLDDGTLLASFPGIVSKLEQNENAEQISSTKERFIEECICPECNGTRLKKDSLYFKIDNKDISEVSLLDIDELALWIGSLDEKMNNKQRLIAQDILKELKDRIGFLQDVGLNYLSLSRSTKSLSGGESQRIRLATQIGSKLVNVLYILDEPSIGLHQRDNVKLIDSLKKLRDENNSVMVVEHDEQMMLECDYLIDLGPAAGANGGELLYSGTPGELLKMSEGAIKKLGSLTAEYLRGFRKIELPQSRREGNG
ncbi:MAG: excinuclease ABC subunit UvrA, partial [Bacteroidia bacterium]|nr:excinuclease ABC subunit UvrA [Bacteroidia bacterium]